MTRHLSANLWLLFLTVLICAVLYPLALLGIGLTLFHGKANGSIVFDKDGKPIGSHLVAQPFAADEYFHPRPSAVSYNAAATGGSNLGPNNPALRARVLAQLSSVLKYGPKAKKPGAPIAPDIESWFQKDQYHGKPGILAQWASANSGSAQAWVKANEANTQYVDRWMKEHAAEIAQWSKDNPGKSPTAEDIAVPFFAWFSKTHPGAWPTVEVTEIDSPAKAGEKINQTKLVPVQTGGDVLTNFYPLWAEEHPQEDVAPVPADMVMASGAGLDPHITLKNALYQLDRVAAKWADKSKRKPADVHKEIESMLRSNATSPLAGLAGPPIVNVLEINLALLNKFGS